MRVFNQQIATAQPLNASFNSNYVPLKSIFMYTMAAIYTATVAGTIKLQASNDPETNDTQYNVSGNRPPSVAPINWVDVTDSTFVLAGAGETMWNVRYIGYNYVRVVFTDTSGGTNSGTMTIIFNGKGA